MFNLNKNINKAPITDDSSGKENKEKLGELEAVPIFRANDLYCDIFPEIKPIFEKGEEPRSGKKIIEAILKNEGKTVILDRTCEAYVTLVKPEDLPKEFGLNEIPEDGLQINDLKKLFKTHFNIEIKKETIDDKIEKKTANGFSPEIVKGLFEMAKKKNSNIKQVYILSLNIADHAPYPLEISNFKQYEDSAKEIGQEIVETDAVDVEGIEEEKKRMSFILAVFKKATKEEFGIEPKLITTINQEDIKEGDLVVVDRHNSACSKLKINEQFPKQVSILPLESEIRNNEKFLGDKFTDSGLIKNLRKDFEKQEENK